MLKKNSHVKLISDECYSRILYDGASIYSLIKDESIRARVFVVNSFSKAYAMTGWRLGWVLGNKDYIEEFAKVAFDIRASVNTAVQYAGSVALGNDGMDVRSLVEKYDRNRQKMMSDLIDGNPIHNPKRRIRDLCRF